MSPAPAVVVVIPGFNAGRFLERAIASVEAQSLGAWEIVVVDDGSTERETLDVLERVPRARVRVVRQANEGLAAARNRGVRESSMPFVQFLDADDLLLPSKLARQAAALQADTEAGAAICDYAFTDESGEARRAPDGLRVVMREPALEDVLLRWERELSIPLHCGLFRRGVWGEGDPFVPGFRAKEDWIFWAGLAARRVRFVYQPEREALYRVHAGQMCRTPADMMAAMSEAALYLAARIPAEMQGPFREATAEHLRTAYAARIDDPGAFRPLRHRL